MAKLFFSYSHKDEALRDELEAHLSLLRRDGTIETWHDRRITAGQEFKGKIDVSLEAADIILLLVSSDFLNSDYCFDVEMRRALERHESNAAHVIPVILRSCEWHSAPFGHLLAAPRDGKAVTSWPDRDEAFTNVASMIRVALKREGERPSPPKPTISRQVAAEAVIRSSNLRIAKKFSEADRDSFAAEAFEFLAKFFESSLNEIAARNPGIEGRFRRLDTNRFTSIAYSGGAARARCKITLGGFAGNDSISYSNNDQTSDTSMNEWLRVDADDQRLFLKGGGMALRGRKSDKLTFEGAAEYYWEIFIEPLQR